MVKRLKVRGGGGHADKGGGGRNALELHSGRRFRGKIQSLLCKKLRKTAFASDVQRCWDWTRERLDEKWTRTPCKANICHRWRVDGMLIRTQGYKSFKPIHPNWAVVGKRWNQSAVAF